MSGPVHVIDIERVVLHAVDPSRVHEMRAALEAQIAVQLANIDALAPSDGQRSSSRIACEAARAVLASVSGAGPGRAGGTDGS